VADPTQPTDPQRAAHSEHHLRTPTHELSHQEKLERERFHNTVLTFALLGVLAMLAYAAAFDIDHPGEWIVLGAICATALGTIVAIKSR
jgi:uncharacterized membrane protein